MQLTRDRFAIAKFLLLRVSTLTRDIDIAILYVCPSVRPSVRDTLVYLSKQLYVSSQFFHHTVAQSF